MNIPPDTDYIVDLIIDCLYEEREIMDYAVTYPSGDTDEPLTYDFDEVDLGQVFALDEDGVFVPIDSGVYKCKCAINAETEEVTVLETTKLSEEEADKCFTNIDFIPDAEL